MKRSAALFLAVLSLAVALSVPPQASALACFCLPSVQQTPSNWAKGPTCQESRNKLYAKLIAYVPCNTCYEEVVYTANCVLQPDGKYLSDGYLKYQCLSAGCDPNP